MQKREGLENVFYFLLKYRDTEARLYMKILREPLS